MVPSKGESKQNTEGTSKGRTKSNEYYFMIVSLTTVQLDLNLMLASTVPAFKIARIACAQP